MSDLATAGHLRQCDDAVSGFLVLRSPRVRRRAAPAVRARARLRRATSSWCPNPGDYHVLAARDDAQMLVRNADGIELLSNICRHRQAMMLNGQRQRAQHRLPDPSLDVRPEGRAARRAAFRGQAVPRTSAARRCRTGTGCCSTARATSRAIWRRSACATSTSRATCSTASRCTACNYNWKTFIEVYLEDYHVGPFHPGLGQFVTCDDLKWEFGDWASVQTVGINNGLAKPGTRDVRALAQGRARLTTAARSRGTARSGSPTTRTSCSSGIRTCS